MGIQDRDYYREEAGGWWTTVHGHRTTWILIAITVGMFLAQIMSVHRVPGEGRIVDQVTQWLGYSLPEVLNGQVWRLAFTPFVQPSMNFIGIGFGMLLLYFAGAAVEELYGAKEFAAFYVLVGFLAAVAKFCADLVRLDSDPSTIGCGPSLSAVLVLFACHYPHHRIRIWFIIPVPAWLLVTIYVGISVLGDWSGSFGPVPYLVVAAFAFGYYKAQRRLTGLIPTFRLRSGKKARPAVRIYQDTEETPEPVASAAKRPTPASASGAGAGVDEQLEAKLDQVLEKVARYGRESLSDEEKNILQRASEIYRQRRRN